MTSPLRPRAAIAWLAPLALSFSLSSVPALAAAAAPADPAVDAPTASARPGGAAPGGSARPAAAARAAVTALRCEWLTDPVGIDVTAPRFSWVVTSPRRGAQQVAYQVLVATSAALLARGTGDVWDSGRVTSDENANVAYAGPPLASRRRYHFTVRAWDDGGRLLTADRPAFFETGFLDPKEWRARFIGLDRPGADDRAPFAAARWIWAPAAAQADKAMKRIAVRATFTVAPDERIRWAELHFAAPNVGKHWLKHNRHYLHVNDTAIEPYAAPIDDPRILVVTKAIRPGENRIAIDAPYWPGKALIAVLRLERADGSVRLVSSDGSWRHRLYRESPKDGAWRSEPTDGAPWAAVVDRGAFGDAIDPSDPSYRAIDTIVPPVYVRRAFTVAKPVARARLYVTAAGIYEARLNGEKVGRDLLTPGWTYYEKRLRYQTYDVTRALRQGANALGAMVASGWYSGRSPIGQNIWGNEKALLAELHVDYADGTSDVVLTDGAWRGATGALRRADMFDGEVVDARREPRGWDRPGFDDRGWARVALLQPKIGVLEADRDPPVRATALLPTRAVTSPAPGVQIFDLGQNFAGWARIRLRAPAGTAITIRYGEMLNIDGTLFTANLRTANAIDRYIAAGRGTEVYEPRFTSHGFRYVEVSGHPGRLPASAVTGVVTHNDLPAAGRFETSNPLLDRLHSNIVWGQRSNFIAVPTDCPQRDERAGWTGDINMFARTSVFNMDVLPFLAKYLVDVDDSQRPDGRFPDVAPDRPEFGSGAFAWADVGVMLPWLLYEMYGDARLLAQHYPAAKRWVDFRTAGAKGFLSTTGGYGDWLSPPPKAPNEVIGPIYHAVVVRLAGRMAEVIGKKDDAAAYAALFEKIKAAWNSAHVAADGKIASDTQTVYVLALRYDMLSPERRAQAAKHLEAAIRRADGHIATGFLGTGNILPALSGVGRDDLAYEILLKESNPSWLFSVKNGATTIWERWDGYSPVTGPNNMGDMNSYNHYALGAVGEWMYGRIGGIEADPAAPAWRRILVRPAIGGGLTHARAEHVTVRGKVATAWKVAAGKLTLDVTVPVHATALVHVPGPADSVTESGKPAKSAPGVRFVGEKDGAALFEVGAGRYGFSTKR